MVKWVNEPIVNEPMVKWVNEPMVKWINRYLIVDNY
jgi:hypothetical protein